MKRKTRFLLLAGCAFVLLLEGPATLSALAEGWRGPYASRAMGASTAFVVLGLGPAELLQR